MMPSHAGVLDAERTPASYKTSIALGLVACLIVGGTLGFAELLIAHYSGPFPSPNPKIVYMVAEIALVIVVALLLIVIAVTLVLRKRGRVSGLVFVDEVLAFGIYFVVLWEVADLGPLVSTLVSGGLSVITVYELLTHRSKRQQPVQRAEEQHASAD